MILTSGNWNTFSQDSVMDTEELDYVTDVRRVRDHSTSYEIRYK